MDKKKAVKLAVAAAVIVIPFSLAAVGGYYLIKRHRKHQAEKKLETEKIN